jgi:hypothetical protein
MIYVGITASVYPAGTSVNDINLLFDCKAFCLPDNTLYFSTGLQVRTTDVYVGI